MIKVRLARNSGFCMGVRRAVEQALEIVHSRPGPIYSYGPLIHNPQALELLASKGLTALEPNDSRWAELKAGTVIIRAHGVPPQVRRDLEAQGFELIDATCPRVIRVQAIIHKHAGQGFGIVIWGSPDHPEVVGLLGYAAGRGHVVRGPEEVAALPDMGRVILVAQTTQNKASFHRIAEAVQARWPAALIFDTICGATERRQDEVRRLSRDIQAMVIVGGHNSGNTQRLAAVAREEGIRVIHVETEAEIDPEWLTGIETVGVTAGASTPNWMIKRVMRRLERIDRRRDTSFLALTRRILRAMILGNVYSALGAGALGLAGALLHGLTPRLEYVGVTCFYVHAMHVLNVYLDKEASKFNDPDRAMFLEKHRSVLVGSGLLSAAVSLILALTLSWQVFTLLLVTSTLGLLYAVPLVPRSWVPRIRIRRLKDIPSSKTLSLSAGWAVTLALVPALAPGGRPGWPTVLAGAVIFILVFIRSALGDIMEIQGDRIVGRETIPILIGEKKTLNLLSFMTGLLVAVLVWGWYFGVLTSLALLMLACAAYATVFLVLFRREQVMGSYLFEAALEANFILAGLLSCLWATF